MTEEPDFKGYIHDVGGPTANFRFPACEKAAYEGSLSLKSSACFLSHVKNLKSRSFRLCGPFEEAAGYSER